MLKSFQFSDGFESVKEIDGRLIVGIPFSIFLLWIELIFYLRQIPGLCHLEILRILRLKIPRTVEMLQIFQQMRRLILSLGPILILLLEIIHLHLFQKQ
ncbi:unnamed protein product [Rhizophagus irregularis]|nr:unnamed protein product [Rhizophagus irregularis]